MENIYDMRIKSKKRPLEPDEPKEPLEPLKPLKPFGKEKGILGSIESKIRPDIPNEFGTLDRRKNKIRPNIENINDFNNMNLNSSEERLFSEIKNNNNLQINIENNSYNKCKLNILYYDENLKNKDENKDICTFFEMNLLGTFYGCHYFELFKNICEKIKRNKIKFILISSGSSAEKIFDYCSNIDEIREYYIYCSEKDKYKYLFDNYYKLKGIYNIFNELKEKLYSIDEIKNDNISSSNFIYFEDYSRIYIKLHYEFIRKYSLYKLLKRENFSESEFLELVKIKYPYFMDLAKQLFPDKKEIINFFENNTNEPKEKIEKIFENDDNILNDNIRTYIQNYTTEGFYYKYLNKFLREGNFDAFRILSSHIAKFVYKLYDYRKNISNQKRGDLYRKMYLNRNDIKLYEQSKGRVICFPSFTSTSLGKDNFIPSKNNPDDELVLLIIEQNKTKSVISISEFAKYPKEEEYLFLPFSFFKIKNVEFKKGTGDDPHLIHLIALDTEKPIEEMFDYFMNNETDNLSPEGLDFLLLTNNDTKIIFNEIYLSKNVSCNCECNII